MICGPNIENGVYRRRYNQELHKDFDSSDALNVKKTSRLRYAGHMISPKTYHKNPMEGEVKEDRNPGGWMGCTPIGIRD
jgi:hypothetical protein